MMNRMTLAAPSAVVMIIAANSLMHQPSHAQTTAQAKADQCLSRPGAAGPKGSHWFYRIERPSGRRCWYLGSEDATVRRAAAAERKSVPTPSPRRPPERRPQEELPSTEQAADTPALAATDTNVRDSSSVATNAATANPVNATGFSAAWPAIPDSAHSSDRDVTRTSGDDAVEGVATAEAQNEPRAMPLVGPAPAPAEQASAAQPFESTPGIASLVIFLAATGAFVAVALRAVLLMWPGWFARGKRGPIVRPAAPVIRRRTPAHPAPTQRKSQLEIEELTEPTVARLRDIAKRWDTPARVPRQPRVLDEEMPGHEIEAPALRRRRVA